MFKAEWIEDVSELKASFFVEGKLIAQIGVARSWIDKVTLEDVIIFGVRYEFKPTPRFDGSNEFKTMAGAKRHAIAAFHSYLGYMWRV